MWNYASACYNNTILEYDIIYHLIWLYAICAQNNLLHYSKKMVNHFTLCHKLTYYNHAINQAITTHISSHVLSRTYPTRTSFRSLQKKGQQQLQQQQNKWLKEKKNKKSFTLSRQNCLQISLIYVIYLVSYRFCFGDNIFWAEEPAGGGVGKQ